MKFADGSDIKPGDVLQIDTVYRGRVVASMDTDEYLPGEDRWAYLGNGIVVDTDFGGLVHYTSEAADDLVLIERVAVQGRRNDMIFSDLQKSALQLNELYEQLETKRYGRIWSTQELALGFMGDVGDLAKLIQANAGIRTIDDCKAKLGHELSDCLWSIIVLANKCGIDLEAEFIRNTAEITEHVSSELGK